MKFIEYNEDKKSGTDGLPNLDKIRHRVAKVKASEKVGVRYMNKWEEEDIIRHEGRKEGREEGREEERLSALRNMIDKLKMTVEQAMEVIGISESDYGKYMSML